jgi:hypothetical protein
VIYITGDTHIPIDIHKLSMKNWTEQVNLTHDDYLIICGDFGGVWNESNEELYWLKWLNKKPFTTLFIDGNHENHDMLNECEVEEYCGGKVHKIMSNIYHLMRGQIFNLNGVKVFTMGGASSHDKIHRKESKSWWKSELPNEDEYKEALNNLDRNNWKVDLVITHCAPDSIQSELANWYEHDKLTNLLETVKQDLSYKKWYFGHYHVDNMIDEKHVAIYDKIEKYIE